MMRAVWDVIVISAMVSSALLLLASTEGLSPFLYGIAVVELVFLPYILGRISGQNDMLEDLIDAEVRAEVFLTYWLQAEFDGFVSKDGEVMWFTDGTDDK